MENTSFFRFVVDDVIPVNLSGQYSGGTCVIVGSGPSVEPQAAATLQQHGASVITLGNACHIYQDSDIWIGRRELSHYHPRAMESTRTLSLLPIDSMQDQLWNHPSKSYMNLYAHKLPNQLFYKRTDQIITNYFQNPGVTSFDDLGDTTRHTTFLYGLSIAMQLGFRNILITGVDLGGTLDNYFAFPEIPHKDIHAQKTRAYEYVKQLFPVLRPIVQKNGVRLLGIGKVGVPSLPNLPVDMVQTIANHISPYAAQVKTLEGVTVPHTMKTLVIALREKYHKAALYAKDLAAHQEPFLALPRFNTQALKKTYLEYQEKLGDDKTCKPCIASRFGDPLFKAVVAAVKEGDEDTIRVWTETFPEKYTLLTGGRIYFRPDKKHLEEELKELQITI
jgi:hypothetical protein